MIEKLSFIDSETEDQVRVSGWFKELIDLGNALASLQDKNFFFAISLPSLQLSTMAISLGLVKGLLSNEVITTQVSDIFNIKKNTKITYFDGTRLINAEFVCIEKNYCGLGEDRIRIKVKDDLEEIIKINDPRKKILFFDENESVDHVKSKKIKIFSGLGEKLLDDESKLKLQTNAESKILFIGNKKDLENQACSEYVKYDDLKYKFNDILRVDEFLGNGQSYFSTVAPYIVSSGKLIDDKNINFKIYIGSNSFLKKYGSYSKIKNTIVLISPSENNYENVVSIINKIYNERDFKSEFDNKIIKDMNLKYTSTLFRQKK